MEQLKYKVVQGDDNNNKGPVVRSFFSSSSSESGISSGSSLDSDSFEEVTSPLFPQLEELLIFLIHHQEKLLLSPIPHFKLLTLLILDVTFCFLVYYYN